MIEADTIRLRDASVDDEAVVIVRYDDKQVALAVSQKLGCDVELFLTKSDAMCLRDALSKAVR